MAGNNLTKGTLLSNRVTSDTGGENAGSGVTSTLSKSDNVILNPHHSGYDPGASFITDRTNKSFIPHITAIRSGQSKWDPVHKSIFEVVIDFPGVLSSIVSNDEISWLTQQVTTVQGLDALNKTTGVSTQKFLGVDVSYLNPVMDNTYADITINFNLNLRNYTDNFVLRLFRIWGSLNYDLADGSRAVKSDYASATIRVAEANRNGDVWRSYQFNQVMLTGLSGLDDLDYSSNDARQLTCTFRSDFWYDTMAGPVIPTITQVNKNEKATTKFGGLVSKLF